jgi:hypothetical protein
MLLAQKPIVVAVAKLVTKLSPAEEGILRLYAYYKRSQRNSSTNRMAEQLAPVIKSELQLLIQSESALRLLAVAMQRQIGSKQYSEDYFMELALWITRLKPERVQ